MSQSIQFVDQTIRYGQQSLWGFTLRTDMVTPIAETMGQVGYDLFHFEHQVPGGMISNLTRQLREIGIEDRTREILEEVIQVRKERGYPVMPTPFSQIVGVQAMENIITGKRYERIPDEVIKSRKGIRWQ